MSDDCRFADRIRPESYASRYSSGNYGAHCMCVTVGPVRVWYSYGTPVAFWTRGVGRVVSENRWSNTTGRHLNEIEPDKRRRVSGEEFERLWNLHVAPILEALDRLSPDMILAAYATQKLNEAAEAQRAA